MTFRRRKVVAVLALVAGGVLIYFELYRPSTKGEACFWVVIGAVVLVLSLMELLTKTPPDDDPRP